jgi:phage FluMu gp28-like protein
MPIANPNIQRGRLRQPNKRVAEAPETRAPMGTWHSYQEPVFRNRDFGILVLHWSRQIGKSYALAGWAVDRVLSRPGRLVTVLSNSRENGAEFVVKAVEISRLYGVVAKFEDLSLSDQFETMRYEVRVRSENHTGRIKVLAANARTARGFSGDLILDEFAFHEDSAAIWEAAEPILSSNADFVCRIASTGNGNHNLFFHMAGGPGPSNGDVFTSASGFRVSRVSRTAAWRMGREVFDMNTRRAVPPAEARAAALDKRAYDQNYECVFNDENMTLLTHELISEAERDGVGFICEQDWSGEFWRLATSRAVTGPLYLGVDVGRHHDLTVMTVLEDAGEEKVVRGVLRIAGMRLPDQQIRLGEICRLPNFRGACIDMTGIGIGLTEYSQEQFGRARIRGINFSASVPITPALAQVGRARETVRVTEAMATALLRAYEDRRLRHPRDGRLRDDLRKPEKVTSPGGRVSIAATRDGAGHADHFWSLALAIEAAGSQGAPFAYESISRPNRPAPLWVAPSKGAIG